MDYQYNLALGGMPLILGGYGPKWDIGPNYVFQRELGSGSYGAVCEARCVKTNSLVAIKKYTAIFSNPVLCRRVIREIEILQMLSHPCIVAPIESFVRNGMNDLYLVMEFAQSDLRKLSQGGILLDKKQIKILFYCIMCALNYLHSGSIVHRDIKPGNILVNSDCSVWLCDFSISRSINGLHSSKFDCDQALRQTPYLGSSMSSFCSYASSSISFPSSFMESGNIESEEDLGEIIEGKKNTTVYCEFEVKMKKTSEKKDSVSKDDIIISRSSSNIPEAASEEEKLQKIELKKRQQRNVLLGKCKAAVHTFQRELTGRIGTRWYRAPEQILLEKVYTTAVDIWAAGCVFAELLGMMKECENLPESHQPLFQGTSCFPLSPSHKPTVYISGMPVSPRDQLNVILSVHGVPQENDLSFLSDKKAENYINDFPAHTRKPLSSLFPIGDPDAIDLLEKMLTFNPYFRITAKEALKHKYFAEVRDKTMEIEFMNPIELTGDQYKDSEYLQVAQPILMNLLHLNYSKLVVNTIFLICYFNIKYFSFYFFEIYI